MNTVIAQGAPNSLIRHFQDNPQHAVDLLRALIAAYQFLPTEMGEYTYVRRDAHLALNQVPEQLRAGLFAWRNSPIFP